MNKYFAPEADVLKISVDIDVCGVSQKNPVDGPDYPGGSEIQ